MLAALDIDDRLMLAAPDTIERIIDQTTPPNPYTFEKS